MIDLNPNSSPLAPTPAPKTPMIIGVVVLICIAAFVGGVFAMNLWQEFFEEREETVDSSQTVEENENGEEEGEAVVVQDDAEIVSTDSELVIDWIDPFKQPTVTVDPIVYEALCPDLSEPESEKPWNLCGTPAQISQVRLGTVVGGVYDGRYLEMVTARVEEMGYSYRSVYLLVDPSTTRAEAMVLLDRMGQSVGQSFPARDFYSASEVIGWSGTPVEQALPGFSIDVTATIPALIPQTRLTDIDGHELIFTGKWLRFDTDFASSPMQATTTIEIPDRVTQGDGAELSLYEAEEGASTSVGDNQYYLIDEDGSILWYDLEVPFFTYEQDGDGNLQISQGVPSITWNDGSVNTQTYMKGALGGCGFTTATNVIADETIETLALVRTGAAQGGISVYEPADYEADYYDDAFNAITFTSPDGESKTYEDFEHPYVYFQDAYERWVELSSIEIIPPVECGKPVIYLYPESTMDMSVWINPRGGFSYTEPEYGDGWNVTAYPDGRIMNRTDGLEYPYLFWEGRGGLYAPVETYWVVEQAGVESFLRSTLSKMNFNQTEIDDFVEFWLPRMQSSMYYKIGFHGTSVMNQLAPLSLSVKPDHMFRILMDYEGLDAWQPSNPPTRLPRANRDGFEVMEWGGVLR